MRDHYTTADGRRIIVVTDRVSAFDRVLGTLPLKGQLLTSCAQWWFEHTRDVTPNHLLTVPDPNVMVVRECQPIPIAMVVRGYLTGDTATSIWTHYERGEREFCGHKLPNGMRKHERLPKPLLTPSTRMGAGGQDVSLSRAEAIATTGVTAAVFDAAAGMAMALFKRGQKLCADRGLILVDTKYEFGVTPEGDLVVIDEIHTPDTSRFWFAETYEDRFEAGSDPESFDKDYLRRWLMSRGFRGNGPTPAIADEILIEAASRYIRAVEQITGLPFRPHLTSDPIGRIRRNLGLK